MKDYAKYFQVPSLNEARKRTAEATTVEYSIDPRFLGIGQHRQYLIQTYGCQANEADSEMIAGIFEQMGFDEASTPEDADIILLNTCAIRDNAEQRIWGELGRLSKLKKVNPDLVLGICGCMTQEEGVVERLLQKTPYVDLIFGTHNIHKLPEYIYQSYFEKERVVEVFSMPGTIQEHIPKKRKQTHKAWIHIMYGCDEFCTYCIVPYTRGKERSRDPQEILKEVEELVALGYKEVTLLGQNVNAYGNDLKTGFTFGHLLFALDKTGIARVRFTSPHPRDMDDLTIRAFAECNSVMEHLHLPVQSGSNAILKKMNRHYTVEHYIDIVEQLRAKVPDVAITTDIIVGFPNETEDDFQATLDLYDIVRYDGAFTFIYSKRDGTPAANWDDATPDAAKKERFDRLVAATKVHANANNAKYVGTVVEVLVDGVSKSDEAMLSGYDRHNKLVNFAGDPMMIGELVHVNITEAKTWFLMGEQVT
jgi:tRNA-2-methylthio-N6-dimethylallyladenosine synthase